MVYFRFLLLFGAICLCPIRVASRPEKYQEYNLAVVSQIIFDMTRNTIGYITKLGDFSLDRVITYHCRTPWVPSHFSISSCPGNGLEKIFPFLCSSRPELIQVFPGDSQLAWKLDTSANLTLIIHGFTDNRKRHWINRLVHDLAQLAHTNVCIVDWNKLATIEYTIAVRNVNRVGDHIGEFLLGIQQHIPLDQVSIIGHSLGAHIAGAVGRRAGSQIDSIFGIDPAHPLMTIPLRPEDQRLDPSDAKFVQVLHTTSGTVGTPFNIGHQDWYADEGKSPQKGCEPGQIIFNPDAFSPVSLSCSHIRGLEIFRFALDRNNRFNAVEADDFYGYWSHRTPGVYHFPTTSKRPYVQVWIGLIEWRT